MWWLERLGCLLLGMVKKYALYFIGVYGYSPFVSALDDVVEGVGHGDVDCGDGSVA